ncbi:Phox homologous domain [Trypanosoma melophagium]|uniref:Phox homologous domain n=1 Tax=Trypanosoma melophagium TaxID=715481 RepID=UPI00351A79D8|nr:Phox homologous domain [Trypanosoma melophagium]
MLRSSADPSVEDHAQTTENPFEEHQQQQQQQQQSVRSNGRTPATKPESAQLATFIVETAVLSTGMVRPITFFPIVVNIRTAGASMYSEPQVPQAPHLGSIDIGVRRNRWAESFPAHVDRRYSELVDFRMLLVYQFPTLIVPPLPPKSKFDDLGTFLTNENVLVAQQHTIVRFLREIAMCPEFIYFSVFTPNFFQLPRESFEDWFASMRSVLDNFRRGNAAIDAHSTRKGGLLGGDSVASFTDGSTKVVRKLVGFIHSWMGGSGGGKEDNDDNDYRRHRQNNTNTTNTSTTTRHSNTAAGTAGENPPRNPPATSSFANPNINTNTNGSPSLHSTAAKAVQYWMEKLRVLTSYREALAAAAQPYLSAMEHAVGAVVAMKEFAVGLERTSAVLHAAGSVHADLERVVREAGVFTSAAAGAIDTQQAKNKREVYERLLFEVTYADAGIDAIDHVLCLWRHLENLVGEPAYARYASYTQNVSAQLQNFYETRFLRKFKRRMRNMIQRMAETGRHYATLMEEAMQNTAFAATIRDKEIMQYNTESLSQYGEETSEEKA